MFGLLKRKRDAEGFTLVEVLVATTLLTVVIALSTGLVIKALDQNSNLTQQAQAQNRNDTGMEQLTRGLRDAVFPLNGTRQNSSIITTALPNQIQFTTRLTGTQDAQTNYATSWSTPVAQVGAQLDTTTHRLLWGTGSQNAGCGAAVCTYAAPAMTRPLVQGVRNDQGSAVCPKNTGDGAVFHYWYVDPSGNLAAWSTGLAAPYNATSYISVVQIDMWTQTQTGPQKPDCVALTDYVKLRNWQ
jgi:prepilin-type N-terminal cleavage/methylation domain-containing protein